MTKIETAARFLCRFRDEDPEEMKIPGGGFQTEVKSDPPAGRDKRPRWHDYVNNASQLLHELGVGDD